MENTFWMVWCEQTCETRVRHHSLEDARREAERLAKKHPGNRFFVLSAQGYAVTARTPRFAERRMATLSLVSPSKDKKRKPRKMVKP